MYRLLNGQEVPSAAKTGISAAWLRSVVVGLSLEAGSEKSPVASTLSSGIEGVLADPLTGWDACMTGRIVRGGAMACREESEVESCLVIRLAVSSQAVSLLAATQS